MTRSLFPPDEHGPVAKLTIASASGPRARMRNREFLANKAAQILRAAAAVSAARVRPPRPFVVAVTTSAS